MLVVTHAGPDTSWIQSVGSRVIIFVCLSEKLCPTDCYTTAVSIRVITTCYSCKQTLNDEHERKVMQFESEILPQVIIIINNMNI